jgi:hypothetical protein
MAVATSIMPPYQFKAEIVEEETAFVIFLKGTYEIPRVHNQYHTQTTFENLTDSTPTIFGKSSISEIERPPFSIRVSSVPFFPLLL